MRREDGNNAVGFFVDDGEEQDQGLVVCLTVWSQRRRDQCNVSIASYHYYFTTPNLRECLVISIHKIAMHNTCTG